MVSSRRSTSLVALVALFTFGALVACGSSAESEPPAGPPPSDPIVYEASAETTRDVGIAKWGYATDEAAGATIFRGYGARNELLVEIRQTFTQTNESTKTFAMQMTGPAATGVEEIDFVTQWTADRSGMEYVQNARVNTFAPGSVGAKILERLGPDATAVLATAPSATPAGVTFPQSVTPLDEKGGLVKPSDDPLLICCSQLTQEAVAMSAKPGTECALVTPSSDPLTQLGTRALVKNAAGQPVVQSPWSGDYHIVDHHCHNAAAQNSSKTDGYIACVASSSTTSTSGHTINWAPDPTKAAGTKGAFCAYEPQSNGGTLISNSVCCWQGNAGKDGAPLFDTAGAQGCATKLCLGQATFPGWFSNWFTTPPKAFPAGSKPPLPDDCPGTTGSGAACNTCCTTQANKVLSLFGTSKNGAEYKKQIEEYRGRCSSACLDRDLQRKAKSAADKCAAAAMDALRAKATAKSTCSSPSMGTATP